MLFEKIKLEDDEKILKSVRRHWFVLFTKVIWVIIGALLPFVFLTVLSSYVAIEAYINMILFGTALWLLFAWMILAQIWTNYYLDLWVITDRRVVRVDQKGFFHRSIGTFRLERLQDMNVEINGIIATFLNFGSIEAQTASGSEEEFQVTGLPDPRELKAIILAAADTRMNKTQGDQL